MSVINYKEAYESASEALPEFVNLSAIAEKSAQVELSPAGVIAMQMLITDFVDKATEILDGNA